MQPYEITQGEYGARLVLRSAWQASYAKMMRDDGIVELELNHAKLWSDEHIRFLSSLHFLLSFELFYWNIQDIEPICRLTQLRELRLFTDSKAKIDFSVFPDLESCSIEWNTGLKSVLQNKRLKRFFVNRFPKRYVDEIGSMTKLEDLSILSCSAESLESLSNLRRLKSLRLAVMRKLESNRFLENLRNLEYLWIQKCGSFTNLEALSQCESLERLTLDDVGTIDSLLPLQPLKNLRRIIFVGTTKLKNPNENVLEELPQLEKFVP